MELLQQMPPGSVGIVYQARNPKLNRVVALRQMQVPDWLDDADDLIKRILAEARSANGLAHANIAQILTGGYKGFTVFVSADFVEGKYLREHVNGATPGLPEVMVLARQLCAAIDYAHGKQVVHYALNFGNIKVLPDGTLKILDFGVLRDKNLYAPTPAKRLENEHYLSPEQVKGRSVDRAANLFSAGVILYELFTTRNPFAGRHLGEVDRNISEVDTIPANTAHSRVSEPVAKVLSKALSKSPAGRFASGQELIDALEEALKVPVAPKTAPSAQGKPAAASKSSGPITQSVSTKAAAQPKVEGTVFEGTVFGAAPAATGKTATGKMAAVAPGTVTLKPVAKPANKAGQWKMMVGIVAAVFVVVAAAISFSNRTEVPPAPPAEKPLILPKIDAPKEQAVAPAPTPQPEVEETPTSRHTGRPIRTAKAEPVNSSAPVVDGQLTITSVPEGAAIEIGGRSVDSWRTPQVIPSLAPGVYVVKVSKAGFATEARSVEVTSGGHVSLEFRLNPTRATLSIGGTPGASIAIDGKPTGKFTPAEFTLEPVSHSVTLRKEGYFDLTSDVKLTGGQTTNFAPNLNIAGRTDNIKVVGGASKLFGGGSHGMSRLIIRCEPKGAHVTVNGAAVPKATPLELQLEPGNYEIVIEKDGYKPLKRSIVTEANGKTTIDEVLPQ